MFFPPGRCVFGSVKIQMTALTPDAQILRPHIKFIGGVARRPIGFSGPDMGHRKDNPAAGNGMRLAVFGPAEGERWRPLAAIPGQLAGLFGNFFPVFWIPPRISHEASRLKFSAFMDNGVFCQKTPLSPL